MRMALKMIQTVDEDRRLPGVPARGPSREHLPPRILCVDDEPDMLEILKDHFTSQGFEVLTATNGMEALFQVARGAPQAVILDLFMPRPGGLVAVNRIKALAPGLPIILISGMPNVLELLGEAGVSVAGAFRKPVDLAQLSEALARAGVMPPSVDGERALGSRLPEASETGGRVLVVDDDPELRQVLVDYLHGKGMEAFGVGDGATGLQWLSEFRPHLVFLDIVMPGLSGVETLRRIMALPVKTCVVMVSGQEDPETLRLTRALGAEDYVPKPVDFGYLDSLVDLHTQMGHFDPERRRAREE